MLKLSKVKIDNREIKDLTKLPVGLFEQIFDSPEPRLVCVERTCGSMYLCKRKKNNFDLNILVCFDRKFGAKVLVYDESRRSFDWNFLFTMNFKEILIDILFRKKSNLKNVNTILQYGIWNILSLKANLMHFAVNISITFYIQDCMSNRKRFCVGFKFPLQRKWEVKISYWL